MSNFLDSAEDLMRRIALTRDVPSVSDYRLPFENVFSTIHWLSKGLAKGNIDLDNLEAVYGAFEMCSLVRPSELTKSIDASKLPADLANVIVSTLQATVLHPWKVNGPRLPVPRIQPSPGHYDVLREAIHNHSRLGHSVSVITFNYDLCLDHMLHAMGNSIDYGFEGWDGDFQLLKLHGSMNWLKDANLGLVLVPIEHILLHGMRKVSEAGRHYKLDIFNAASKFGLGKDSVPFIVPPTFSKGSRYAEIGQVWAKAASTLAEAEHIRFIGYSLPASDYFFNALFSIGTISSTRIKSIVAIDVDKSGATERRYQTLFGPLSERRFKYIDTGFGPGLRELEEIDPARLAAYA